MRWDENYDDGVNNNNKRDEASIFQVVSSLNSQQVTQSTQNGLLRIQREWKMKIHELMIVVNWKRVDLSFSSVNQFTPWKHLNMNNRTLYRRLEPFQWIREGQILSTVGFQVTIFFNLILKRFQHFFLQHTTVEVL